MRTSKIVLGEKIHVDVNKLWRTALAMIGNSGSGKTLAGRELIEESYTYGSQVIFDLAKGELVTLREKFDYLLIGPNGDMPADPEIAPYLARFVREKPCRVIVDLSRVDEDTKQLFVQRFGDTLLALPESKWDTPLLVFIDEVHLVAPQEERPASRKTVGNLSTLGRAQRICLTVTTQRLAEVSKKLLNSINNRMYGRFIEPVDMKAAADVLGLTRKDWPMMQQLEEGWFHCMGPAFSTKGVFLARTSGKTKSRHIDRSAGDKVKKIPASRRVTAIAKDLLAKQAQLAAQQKREQDELGTLRARVKQLEGGEIRKLTLRIKQLEAEAVAASKSKAKSAAAGSGSRAPVAVRERVVEVADPRALQAAHDRGWAEGRRSLAKELDTSELAEAFDRHRRVLATALKIKIPAQPMVKARTVTRTLPAASTEASTTRRGTHTPASEQRRPQRDAPTPRASNGKLGGAPYAVLMVLLMHDGLTPRKKVAHLAKLHPNKSTFRNALTTLRSAQYMIETGDEIGASDSARRDYPDAEKLPVGKDLIDYWRRRIGNSSAPGRLFEVLADAEEPLTDAEAAASAGMDPHTSTYRNAKTHLRKRSVLQDLPGGKIQIPDEIRGAA